MATTVRRRSRHKAEIKPDLRSLRQAFGLSLGAASQVVGEPASLLLNQEESVWPDIATREACARRYVEHGLHTAPPSLKTTGGTSPLYRLRVGLGLSLADCASISSSTQRVVEAMESAQSALPPELKTVAWTDYLQWAQREYRRIDRWRAAQPESPHKPLSALTEFDQLRETNEVHRLAYAPPITPKQAEAHALRWLSGD